MNLKQRKKMKILFVASEMVPFAKAGGLADVIHALPLSLRGLKQDVRTIIPHYRFIDREKYKTSDEVKNLKVPTDDPNNPFLDCSIKKYVGEKDLITYFLENEEYFGGRSNIYGYADDHVRWVLLCRGVLEFIKKSPWKPDLIVASDWQTGLIPNYIKTKYKKDKDVSSIPVVYAIHNLSFQGMADFRFIPEEKKDDGKSHIPSFFDPRLGSLNWALRGILNSDRIVTVSPGYAKEITTSEFGEGLEKILKKKEDVLSGIINGIDESQSDPEKSPHIPFHYNSRKLSIRKKNKIFLQEKFNLPKNPDVFLLSMVSRFTEQKGFDLLGGIGNDLFKNLDVQMVIIGDGDPRFKSIIKNLSEKYPNKIKAHLEFNTELPNLAFAGSDAHLMPSKFEPCGLNQMQAMRYGCIPIVRKTGGLASTVDDFDPINNSGNGFVFTDYDATSFYGAIVRAHTVFGFKDVWTNMIKRAMKKDSSWKESAKEYLELFQNLLNKK